ncbi:hypothetical protein [Pseudomonas sp. GL-RE-19]|uniref:hypothetical protein n=1 Tax=Pseudomonas sp. GL-RE-19 TaxID=2832389 RepID=UPI001CBF4C8A|nr:hypothetical protein [Pseudomonas sp. GL-RE-19]
MSNDDRRNLLFDAQELDNLRRECRINSIDFSRARLRTSAGGGYVVVWDAPLFDLGDFLLDPPSEASARTAAMAEGLMLQGLLRIQRSERLRLRMGRTVGWSQDQIGRRPLSADEVDEYLASVAHKKEVARLQRELTQVLEANAKNATATAGNAELKERYGFAKRKPAKKPEAELALPSAHPRRAPSRGEKA